MNFNFTYPLESQAGARERLYSAAGATVQSFVYGLEIGAAIPAYYGSITDIDSQEVAEVQDNYRPALEIAQRNLRAIPPSLVAKRSGAELRAPGMDGDELRVKLFNREYRVPLPEALVYDAKTGTPAGVSTTLVVLHYLAATTGGAPSGEWIPFRSLPGGNIYEHAFRRQCFDPLIAAFGTDPEKFERAAGALCGVKASMGDRSFIFQALPQLPVACVLWLADEEQGAEVNLLYDAAAPRHLPTEDLAALGRMLAFGLIQQGGR